MRKTTDEPNTSTDLEDSYLAVDIASSAVSALLHVPETQGQNAFGFRFPSPGKILAGRIRQGTALRRSLYLKGNAPDPCVTAPLLAHLSAGLEVCLHPDYAALLSATPGKTESLGIRVSPEPARDALVLESCDISPEQWSSLIQTAGLPRPKAIFTCADESGYPLDAPCPRPLAPWLPELFACNKDNGIPLADLSCPQSGPHLLRLSTIQRITGFPVLDSAIAFIFGMASLPGVASRSQREGVTVLHMGRRFIRAALLYRKRLFALLELPAGGEGECGASFAHPSAQMERLKPQELMLWLDDLRLGWLPEEKAMMRNGLLYRAENFPPEAEGFRPLFIAGQNALSLAGLGRIMDSGHEAPPNCRGLLAAFGNNAFG